MIKRVYLEITNHCNLQCSFCNQSKREKSYMSISTIAEILADIKKLTSYIYLHVKGEPLLHPNFIEIMDLMQQYDMKVQLVSNGTFIKNYPNLIRYTCLRKISFSLHSVPYQTMDVEQYLKPILEFINLARNSAIHCELRFWNENHLDQESQLCLEAIKQHFSNSISTTHNNIFLQERTYLSFDNQFEWPALAANQTNHGRCYGAKNMLAVLVDGTVVPCCLDDEGEIVLGNIFTASLQNIMNTKRYKAIVQGFNDNKCIELLCQKCSYRQRFD